MKHPKPGAGVHPIDSIGPDEASARFRIPSFAPASTQYATTPDVCLVASYCCGEA